jgi:hypothetical protein
VKRSDSRRLSLILVLCLALATSACNAADMITVAISGRVVVEGSDQPLANHEVELWTLKLPSVPVGMGSYVKNTTVRTDAAGRFSLSAEVPDDRRFELRTSNPGTVFGGGAISLEPASSITDVTIVHKMPIGSKEKSSAD